MDSLRFTVSVTDVGACTAFVTALPTGTRFTRDGEASIIVMDPSSNFPIFTTAEVVIPGCGEVTITFDFTGDECEDCGPVDITLGGIDPIPTLGQWGLITLSLMFFIFGLVKLRSGFVSPVIRY